MDLEDTESKSTRRACLNCLVVGYGFFVWLLYLNYVIMVVFQIMGYLAMMIAPQWVRSAGILFTLCALCATLFLSHSHMTRIHAVGKIAAPLLLTGATVMRITSAYASVYTVVAAVALTAVAIFFSSAVICHQMRPLLRMHYGLTWIFLDILLLDLAVMFDMKLFEQSSVQLVMIFSMVPTVLASYDPAALLVKTTLFKRHVREKFGTTEPYVCVPRRIYNPAPQRDTARSTEADPEDPMHECDRRLIVTSLKVGTVACVFPFFVVLTLFALNYNGIVDYIEPSLGLSCVQAAAGVTLGFSFLDFQARNRYIIIGACGVMSLAASACVTCVLFSIMFTAVVLIIGSIFGGMLIVHGMIIINDPRRTDDKRQLGFFLIMFALLLLMYGHQLTSAPCCSGRAV